ncbi:MAG: SpoIIE family protein phosphatase [Bryobacteraceae bacterium]
MAAAPDFSLQGQLLDRRQRLQAVTSTGHAREAATLLQEVDAALARMERGVYGLCEVCNDPVEPDRLLADPTTRFCLDHMTPSEQKAFEEDLSLAARIQRELLPKTGWRTNSWDLHYHYLPAGVVSGDYCDVVPDGGGGFFFAVGDVTGKGIAASMLMAHIHAMFRTLLSLHIPLAEMMTRASRLFCESTLPTHFATLVCGAASADGHVEICNAGHPPPLWLSAGRTQTLDASGLPVGMFCSQQFTSTRIRLQPDDALVLYTDGALETENERGEDFGLERLSALLALHAAEDCRTLLSSCLQHVTAFGKSADDLTLLAIRRLT